MGAEVNAATWLDWTYYHVDLPESHLERVIALEADRLVNLDLTEEVLEAERQVVMNERRECVEDDPCETLSEKLWFHLLGEGYPYAHSTIGWMKDIEQLSLTDCQNFYETCYSPSNIILVVTGAVKAERLIHLIEAYYLTVHSVPNLSLETPQFFPASKTDYSEPLTLHLEIYAPRLHVGFRTFELSHPDSLVLECLDELLFEGDSARLYKRLVYDKEVASSVYSAVPQFRGEAVYEMIVELLPHQDPQFVLSQILEELESISCHGIETAELERIKLSKELMSYRSQQTVQQKGYYLGFWQSTADDFKQNFTRLNLISEVTSPQIQRVAKYLLTSYLQQVIIAYPQEYLTDELK